MKQKLHDTKYLIASLKKRATALFFYVYMKPYVFDLKNAPIIAILNKCTDALSVFLIDRLSPNDHPYLQVDDLFSQSIACSDCVFYEKLLFRIQLQHYSKLLTVAAKPFTTSAILSKFKCSMLSCAL